MTEIVDVELLELVTGVPDIGAAPLLAPMPSARAGAVKMLSPAARITTPATPAPSSNVVPIRREVAPAAKPQATAAPLAPAAAPPADPPPQPPTGDDLRAMNNFVAQQVAVRAKERAEDQAALADFFKPQPAASTAPAPAEPPEEPAPAPRSSAPTSGPDSSDWYIWGVPKPYVYLGAVAVGLLATGGLVTWAVLRKPMAAKKNPAPPKAARKDPAS